MVRYWGMLLREAAELPFLDVFKILLHKVLRNLT